MEELSVSDLKSKQISTLCKYDTDFSADSVEWCPHKPHQNYFVCGNYQLVEGEARENDSPKKRLGRILLFSISPKSALTLHQTIATAAVLDQKWCHNKINNFSILGVVNAEGTIQIYKLNPIDNTLHLLTSLQIPKEETETLLLSLDWSTGKYPSQEPKVVCSDSKGNIHTFILSNDKLQVENKWHAHSFEAWIVGFYYWDTNVIFTGGDDSLLLMFDARIAKEPVLKNKSHEAGVTAFHSSFQDEFIVATGSYDSYVRMWDTRKIKTPISNLEMPGPLWRLKWDPWNCNYLLAACMLGGAHIIRAADKNQLTIAGSYYEHKNITYGCDWCYLSEEEVQQYETEGERIIATCSFYDHLLCISKFALINK